MFYTASTWKRLFAYLIDSMIVMLCWMPLWIQNIFSYLANGTLVLPLRWLLACFLFQFLYKWLFLYFMGGTLGKLMFGLRVRDVSLEKPLGLMQSFLRVLADHLSLFFSHGLQALALLRFDRTHVSDWVAETRVVQKMPRLEPARRRFILAFILFFYFSTAGFASMYKTIKKSQFIDQSIVIELGH